MEKATTFIVVIVGWIFSLCLHEFSHSVVAYYGGDTSVKDKGYLTFNPLKYTNPVLSIILPVIFLLLGGIGLPGGAVYIESSRLRSKRWESAVSLAGPAANLVVAVILANLELCASLLQRHLAGTGVPGADAGLGGGAEPDPSAAVRRLSRREAVPQRATALQSRPVRQCHHDGGFCCPVVRAFRERFFLECRFPGFRLAAPPGHFGDIGFEPVPVLAVTILFQGIFLPGQRASKILTPLLLTPLEWAWYHYSCLISTLAARVLNNIFFV